MPIYEYICQTCGHPFEKMVGFSQADQLPECPHCKSPQTSKRISLFASRSDGPSLGGSSYASSCGTGSGGFT
ncbi:MAG: zinc ribbon domain-containing protein [Anaerolineaceae bacterium]|nr:zinc ribbon domain-containing protein [Anaerolineaceae bacterium]